MNKTTVRGWRKDLALKVFLALVLLLTGGKILLEEAVPNFQSGASQDRLTARSLFANCLNGQGAMMYGVDTCEFCLAQKKMFGEAFRNINYINCDFSRELCRKNGVTRLPVWDIQGKRIYGLQSFEQLELLTGCQAPNEQ